MRAGLAQLFAIAAGIGGAALGCSTTTDVDLPEGHLVVADFDGDGSLDVATISVYRGITVGLAKGERGFEIVRNNLAGTGAGMGVSADSTATGIRTSSTARGRTATSRRRREWHTATARAGSSSRSSRWTASCSPTSSAQPTSTVTASRMPSSSCGRPTGMQQIRVLFGRRDRTMRLGPDTTATPLASTSDHNGAVLDANEDGIPDVAVLGDDAEVYLGNPDGTFGRMVRVGPRVGGTAAEAPVAGDFDGDGHVDLFASRLWLGDGSGGFRESLPDPTPGSASRRSTIVLDVDGDGRDEIAYRSFEDDDASLVLLRFDGAAFRDESWPLPDSPDIAAFGRAVVAAGETVRIHHLD